MSEPDNGSEDDAGADSNGEPRSAPRPESAHEWRALVPVEVLTGETVMNMLSTLPVTVLGYHVLPDQTAPGQARMQFEDRAQKSLDGIAAGFRNAGGAADTRLVFTRDEAETIDRVAAETGCEAIVHPNPSTPVEKLLVPVREDTDVDRVAEFVAALVGDRDMTVTFFHVADSEADTDAGRGLVDDAVETLVARGLPAATVASKVTVAGSVVTAIGEEAVDHDAVVMGETAPSLWSLVFGEAAERIAARTLGPVVSVRRLGEDR